MNENVYFAPRNEKTHAHTIKEQLTESENSFHLIDHIFLRFRILTVIRQTRMAEGRYVRAPQYATDSEDEESDEQVPLSPEPANVNDSDNDESVSDASQYSLSGQHVPLDDYDDDDDVMSKEAPELDHLQLGRQGGSQVGRNGGRTVTETEGLVRHTTGENAELYKRMDQFEKLLHNLTSTLNNNQRHHYHPSEDDIDKSWSSARAAAPQQGPSQSIRWDHIKAFPKGIPANRMWEAWHSYIETFEIAASLGNAFDQSKRAQLLFLSVGEEMQSVIRAAKLRPNLAETDCYVKFVTNIDSHLKSMTDTSAELEAFANMQQGKDESIMNFHARLVEKVRLCGYNPADQERFVRAQLIKGMLNRELAKAARTYGYETNFIVQSAIRDSSTDSGVGPSHLGNVFALQGHQPTTSGAGLEAGSSYQADIFALEGRRSRFDQGPRQRRSNLGARDARQADRSRSRTRIPGRRALCSRCRYLAHRNEQCPALSRNCNTCGLKGHFAAACRLRRVSNARQDRSDDYRNRVEIKEQV